jgi:universal stress protein E
MGNPERILVVVDPTAEEQPAAERGAALARKAAARLELFICDYDQYLAGQRFFDSDALKDARASLIESHTKRLRQLAEALGAGGDLDVEIDAAWDHPLHDGIVRKVVESRPTLVLKDTHYHSRLKRSIFSNTDWHLIRDCPAPLLLVKPGTRRRKKAIIAAVDPVHERDKPAALDHAILQQALVLGRYMGGVVHVLHGFDPSPAYAVSADSMTFPIAVPMKDTIAALKNRHDEAVGELVAGYDIPKENVHLLEGETRNVLIGLAEKLGASTVVMGAVARSAVKRLMLGSTAEQVLDKLPCDLLIVKPPGFETRVEMTSEEHPGPGAHAQDIEGTLLFDGELAARGYALNKMCYSFNSGANRDEFLADEDAYCSRFGLNEQQRDAIRKRDVLALLEAGGNIYYLAKFAGIFNLNVQDIGAQQTGMTVADFKEKLQSAGN